MKNLTIFLLNGLASSQIGRIQQENQQYVQNQVVNKILQMEIPSQEEQNLHVEPLEYYMAEKSTNTWE